MTPAVLNRPARFPHLITAAALLAASCLMPACGGSGEAIVSDPVVTLTAVGPNAVSYWNEVATNTVNQPANATGTPEEQRTIYGNDLATVHVAIYDAVMAITRSYRAYAITPIAAADGASQEAATAAAAYRVLLGLFPSRSATYQPAYDSYLATLADGTAKTKGIAVGAEVAAGVLALRANDGRSVVLAAYVPGTAPGNYRGATAVNRFLPSVKPFALTGNAQFRAPGPPALNSAAYAADLNETRLLGGTASTTRTADQTEVARFHTEGPGAFWPRNIRSLALTGAPLAEQARLMAMLWVTHADATNACFESKYNFNAWRPLSAIPLADTDGNDATAPDTAWTPVVPTPPHPEYPAAHGCVSGALAETLRQYFASRNVVFDFSSSVTSSTHHYASVDALTSEVALARIAGGMHFRTSVVDGQALGKSVAAWTLAHNFQPR